MEQNDYTNFENVHTEVARTSKTKPKVSRPTRTKPKKDILNNLFKELEKNNLELEKSKNKVALTEEKIKNVQREIATEEALYCADLLQGTKYSQGEVLKLLLDGDFDTLEKIRSEIKN